MGTTVGTIFLDLVVKDTVKKQVEDMAASAQQQAQRSFDAVGKAAGDAVQRAMGTSYNKTMEKAKARVKGLESEFDALGAKMDAMRESTKGLFAGVKDPGAVAQRYLDTNKAFQDLAAQQEALVKKMEQAQEGLRIETENDMARMAAAQERAQERAAAAAERAAQRKKAAEEKASAAAERAAQRQQAAQERLEATKRREQERATAAAERAAQRQQVAAERAAAAQKRESEQAAAAAQRAQEKAARASERQWKKSTQGMRRLFRTISSTLKATFLTAGLYAFFRAMKALMGGALSENKQFSQSLAQVKANLATAFQPIVQAILPALTALMNGLASVTRSIASFISGLFGTTYKKAGAAAKKVQGVGAAAKKTASQVAAFDELNVLQKGEESGGGTGGGADFAQQGDEAAEGLGEKLRALFAALPGMAQAAMDKIGQLFGPSFEAWGAAWEQIKTKAMAVWPQIQQAAAGLWENGLKPLGAYLAEDFAPSVANSFSEAFAPITGDLISAKIQIFADGFAWRCAMMTDAIQSVLMPALELLKNVWVGVMDGISATWEEYGKPLTDGLVEAFNNIRMVITTFWETVIKPFLEYVIAKAQELWDQSLKPLWDNLVGLFADIGLCLLTWWNEVWLPFVNWIVQTFGPVVEAVWEQIVNIVGLCVTRFSGIMNVAISALRGLLQFFTAVFKGDWDAAWNTAGETVDTVWKGIKQTVKNTVNGIIGIVNGMINAVEKGVNAIVDALNSIKFDIPDWVPFFGGKSIDLGIPRVNFPRIPALANGGVIKQPTLAMMGEYAGAGNNPEIAAPEDKLRGIFAEGIGPLVEAIQELVHYLMEDGDRELIIRFAASGGLEQLVRLLKPYIDREDNRRGAKLIAGGVY